MVLDLHFGKTIDKLPLTMLNLAQLSILVVLIIGVGTVWEEVR